MVSVPWSTSVFPAGKDIPTLLQFIMGRGRPSASQTTWQVVRFTGLASDGGTFVKIGRPENTIRCYTNQGMYNNEQRTIRVRIFWTMGATILKDDTNFKLSYFKRYINVNTYNYHLLSINFSGILIVEVDSKTKKETNPTNKSKTHKKNLKKREE